MANATINIPCEHKGKKSTMQASGKIAWFKIGNKKIKFLIHYPVRTDGKIVADKKLTHFASGYGVGFLSDAKNRMHKTGFTVTDRAAAEYLVDQLVNRYGADTVLDRLAGAPVINQ